MPAGSFSTSRRWPRPITVSYNLSGVDKLQLSPDTLAKIFQRDDQEVERPGDRRRQPGRDPAGQGDHRRAPFRRLRHDQQLHQVPGGGRAVDWKLGSGDTVAWPADTQAGEKNTGVAQLIKQTDGAIGYVDFADAPRPAA